MPRAQIRRCPCPGSLDSPDKNCEVETEDRDQTLPCPGPASLALLNLPVDLVDARKFSPVIPGKDRAGTLEMEIWI